MIEKLYSVDNGLYKDLLIAVRAKEICFECSFFNQTLPNTPDHQYRCKCAPQCIGATLSPELISLLLWKAGVKTEQEHGNFLGL